MSYTKTVYVDGQAPFLNAQNLNKSETAIKKNADDIDTINNNLLCPTKVGGLGVATSTSEIQFVYTYMKHYDTIPTVTTSTCSVLGVNNGLDVSVFSKEHDYCILKVTVTNFNLIVGKVYTVANAVITIS